MGHQRQRWPQMSFFGISADELMDCSHQLDGVEIDHIQVTGNWPIQGMTVSAKESPQKNLEPGGFLHFKSFKVCVERRDCGAMKSVMGSSVVISDDHIPAITTVSHSFTVCSSILRLVP